MSTDLSTGRSDDTLLKAATRDSSFYAQPSYGRGTRWHAIVDRDAKQGRGPACGYPFHDETNEIDARRVETELRCGRPGCRKAFADVEDDSAPAS